MKKNAVLFCLILVSFTSFAKAGYETKCDSDVLTLNSNRPEIEYLDCSNSGYYLKAVLRGAAADKFSAFLQQAGAGVMGGGYDPQAFVQSSKFVFFSNLKCIKPTFGSASCKKGGVYSYDLSADDSKELVKIFKRARVSKNSEGYYTPADVSCMAHNIGAICQIADHLPAKQ